MIIEKRDYYNRGAVEAIDAIESACTGLSGFEGFLTGTVLKYMFRWRWKGTAVAAQQKADYYLTRLIEEEKRWLGISEEHARHIPEHFGQDMSAMAEDTK